MPNDSDKNSCVYFMLFHIMCMFGLQKWKVITFSVIYIGTFALHNKNKYSSAYLSLAVIVINLKCLNKTGKDILQFFVLHQGSLFRIILQVYVR